MGASAVLAGRRHRTGRAGGGWLRHPPRGGAGSRPRQGLSEAGPAGGTGGARLSRCTGASSAWVLAFALSFLEVSGTRRSHFLFMLKNIHLSVLVPL